MKKKILLVLITLFTCGINWGYSQTKIIEVRNGSYSLTAPASIIQYQDAKFIYKKPKISGDISAIQWMLPWGTINTGTKELPSEGEYSVTEHTFLFSNTGETMIKATGCQMNVNVIPNPLMLNVPSHICPNGTQLSSSTKFSSAYEKRYSVKGNSTAQITKDGLLTYKLGSTGSVVVNMSIGMGDQVFASVEKSITLNPHSTELYGRYDLETNGRIQSVNLSKGKNEVNNGQPVKLSFSGNLQYFSWEALSPLGATTVNYDKNTKTLNFTPSYQYGFELKFRFKYIEDLNCTHVNTCDYTFKIRDRYSVSYMASSNVIRISKENDPMVVNYISSQSDTYRILDVLTGVVQKTGQLEQDINDIDVANISKGVYIVQIISSGEAYNYKILINK